MAKVMNDAGPLDPVMYGEVAMTRRTKGTAFSNGGTGFNLKFNIMPPGMTIVSETREPDDVRINDLKPLDPQLKGF